MANVHLKPLRVAVIGTGVAGMAAASRLLRQATALEEQIRLAGGSPDGYKGPLIDLVMYEKGSHVGGHAMTLDVPINIKDIPSYKQRDDAKAQSDRTSPAFAVSPDTAGANHKQDSKVPTVPVDCGFMVFNHVTYPNMLSWFKENSVEIQESDMSFAVSVPWNVDQKPDDQAKRPDASALVEWASHGPDSIFAQRSNAMSPAFLRMLYDLTAFKTDALSFLDKLLTEETAASSYTMGKFLQERGYSYGFINYYLIPVLASVWSTPTATALDFPARFILEFMRNHHLLQLTQRPLWYTVKGRTRDGYVKKVTAPFRESIRLNTAVTQVTPVACQNGDTLVKVEDSNGGKELFDHVIIAAHAPDALRMLGELASDEERRVLGAFKYQSNDIWLHRDKALMPYNRRTWAAWNFLGGACVTYWLDILQSLDTREGNRDEATVEETPSLATRREAEHPICITLNPPATNQPAANLTVKRFSTEHPVPSLASVAAQRQGHLVQGVQGRNLWFVGAYWGFGFHEDGVKSGFETSQLLWNKIAPQLAGDTEVGIPTIEKPTLDLLSSLRQRSKPLQRNSSGLISSKATASKDIVTLDSIEDNRWVINKLTKMVAPNLVQMLHRTLVLRTLNNFVKEGQLVLQEMGGRRLVFGNPLRVTSSDKLQGAETLQKPVELRVLNASFYSSLFWRADLGLADAYEHGAVEADYDDWVRFLLLMLHNRDIEQLQQGKIGYSISSFLMMGFATLQHRLRSNNIKNASDNIHAHYDLGNDFFALFLDPLMNYSCAKWKWPQERSDDEKAKNEEADTLEAAQVRKLQDLTDRLHIDSSQDTVLEIGSGWGALSRHIARQHGCRVVGITLSEEQLQYCITKAQEEGLDHLCSYRLIDYRSMARECETHGTRFSRIVSCEMIEAVGHEYLGVYFAACDSMLAVGGVMALQGITTPNFNYEEYRKGVDFINERIFPGGHCPSQEAVFTAMAKHSRLQVEQMDNTPLDYARTLAAWRKRLWDARLQVEHMYGASFFRLWDYYLFYCQAGYQARSLGLLRMTLSRTRNPYIAPTEAVLPAAIEKPAK